MLGHFGAGVQRAFTVGPSHVAQMSLSLSELGALHSVCTAECLRRSRWLLRVIDMQRDVKSLRIGISAEVEEPEEPMMVSELPLGLDLSKAPI